MNITERGQQLAAAELTGVALGPNSATMGFKGGACSILAEALGEQLYASGAENYLELRFTSVKHQEAGEIVVTLQRSTGKSPHQLRRDAELRCKQLQSDAIEVANDVLHLVNRNAKIVGFLRELSALEYEHPYRERIDQVLAQLIEENPAPAGQ